jgi:hypothetical protein
MLPDSYQLYDLPSIAVLLGASGKGMATLPCLTMLSTVRYIETSSLETSRAPLIKNRIERMKKKRKIFTFRSEKIIDTF